VDARPGPPPPSVCVAFGADAPVRLPGGQGSTYAAGDVVLKPVFDEREGVWLAAVLAALPEPDDLRIIRPVAATSGRWVVDGWSAWRRLPGTGQTGRWQETLEVSRRFHAAVARVPWSDAIASGHAWAIGDRFAWGEGGVELPRSLRAVASRLAEARRDLDLPSQLVHGDLLSNVLFDDGAPPAVIDVSPRWRPARYADAIVVADAIAWADAPADAIDALSDDDGRQLLIRAVLFRLGAAAVLGADQPGRLEAECAAYEKVASALHG
jgi:uncharacterized protein (TIGR02569 family)